MRNNLGLYLRKRAQLNARMEAIVEVERNRRFTYEALNERCNRIAAVLRDTGVGRGDRVALLLMNGVEYVESFLACAKLGAIMVPLNWRLVADELDFILADSAAKVLLFDAEFDEIAAALNERETPVEHWVRAGDTQSCPDWAGDYDALTAAASADEVDVTTGGDDRLFIMYTSGTTGLPKGVVHTHDTIAWASLTLNMSCDLRPGDRYLQAMPLFHVGALLPAVAIMHRGATLIMLRAFDPDGVFDVIGTERCTIGLLVPTALKMMWDSPQQAEADLSSLRWILCGAAPVPVSLIEAYASRGVEIHQVYGLTECGGPACVISSADAIEMAGSTGPAFFHTDVRVVDDAGAGVAPGDVGEVIVKGPHIMVEYWNRPEATAEAIRDGWLHTGDLASIDERGFVYIRDRKKDMIISGGENIYPAEVENVLAAHPQVQDCAVIGIPSSKWGEVPLAVVSLKDGEAVAEADILSFFDGKLAKFKIPHAVEFDDDIPRNPSGKILKRVLRERYSASTDRSAKTT